MALQQLELYRLPSLYRISILEIVVGIIILIILIGDLAFGSAGSITNIIISILNALFYIATGGLGIYAVRQAARNMYSRPIFIVIMVLNILVCIGCTITLAVLIMHIVNLSRTITYTGHQQSSLNVVLALTIVALVFNLIIAVLSAIAAHIARKNLTVLRAPTYIVSSGPIVVNRNAAGPGYTPVNTEPYPYIDQDKPTA